MLLTGRAAGQEWDKNTPTTLGSLFAGETVPTGGRVGAGTGWPSGGDTCLLTPGWFLGVLVPDFTCGGFGSELRVLVSVDNPQGQNPYTPYVVRVLTWGFVLPEPAGTKPPF